MKETDANVRLPVQQVSATSYIDAVISIKFEAISASLHNFAFLDERSSGYETLELPNRFLHLRFLSEQGFTD